VPEFASQRHQPKDDLLYLIGKVALVTEVTGGSGGEYLVEQLITGHSAQHRAEMSLETTRNVVPSASRASHRRYQLNIQDIYRWMQTKRQHCNNYYF